MPITVYKNCFIHFLLLQDTAGVAIKLRKAKAVIERPATCDAIETGFSDKKICTSADTLVGGCFNEIEC